MDREIDKNLTLLLGTVAKMKGIARAKATFDAMSELIVKLKANRNQIKKAKETKKLDVEHIKQLLTESADLFNSANGSKALLKEARAFT